MGVHVCPSPGCSYLCPRLLPSGPRHLPWPGAGQVLARLVHASYPQRGGHQFLPRCLVSQLQSVPVAGPRRRGTPGNTSSSSRSTRGALLLARAWGKSGYKGISMSTGTTTTFSTPLLYPPELIKCLVTPPCRGSGSQLITNTSMALKWGLGISPQALCPGPRRAQAPLGVRGHWGAPLKTGPDITRCSGPGK